ncbi:hypothetical protein [Parachlamydia sp. AcF125]|uniref:hypothetical protein n=1 Tax=Parachlamydia sp. AcF125 TaxID=2795736 RepID=UPI001BC9D775|nr:hypothetical protein [Parachlamydia sp. AcF125]MBS4169125.1 hypothetical protein [Parachlamydia sp. AcF125]
MDPTNPSHSPVFNNSSPPPQSPPSTKRKADHLEVNELKQDGQKSQRTGSYLANYSSRSAEPSSLKTHQFNSPTSSFSNFRLKVKQNATKSAVNRVFPNQKVERSEKKEVSPTSRPIEEKMEVEEDAQLQSLKRQLEQIKESFPNPMVRKPLEEDITAQIKQREQELAELNSYNARPLSSEVIQRADTLLKMNFFTFGSAEESKSQRSQSRGRDISSFKRNADWKDIRLELRHIVLEQHTKRDEKERDVFVANAINFSIPSLPDEGPKDCSLSGLQGLLRDLEISKGGESERVHLHAQIRLQLFYHMCQGYYQSGTTTIEPVRADMQMGKGKLDEGTAACHHSMLANVRDNFLDSLYNSCLGELKAMSTDKSKNFDAQLMLKLKAIGLNIDPEAMIAESEKGKTLQEQLHSLFVGIRSNSVWEAMGENDCLFAYLNNRTMIAPALINEVDNLIETQRAKACQYLTEVAAGKITPSEATLKLADEIISLLSTAERMLKRANENLDQLAELGQQMSQRNLSKEEKIQHLETFRTLTQDFREWQKLIEFYVRKKRLHHASALNDTALFRLFQGITREEKLTRLGERDLDLLINDCQNFMREFLASKEKYQQLNEFIHLELEGSTEKHTSYQALSKGPSLLENDLTQQIALISHNLSVAKLRSK